MALAYIHTPPPVNFSLDQMLFVVESGKMSGTPGDYTPDEDNLWCYVRVLKKVDADPTHDKLLAEKYIPYSRKTKRAEFDIHDIIDIHPTLPKISGTAGDTSHGQATDTYISVQVAVADNYGVPTYHEYMLDSDYKSVIYGSSRTIIPVISKYFDLHAYVDDRGIGFAKPISKSQPDWLYFFIGDDGSQTIDMEVTMYFEDGTDDSFTQNYTFANNPMVNWIAVGYTQLDLDSHAAGNTIISYKVELAHGLKFASMKFNVVAETDWEKYLIMDNGLGGIESVRISGKWQMDVDVRKNIAVQNWDKNNYAKGQLLQYNSKGQEKWTMRTGWSESEAYIEHLKQVIVGDIWLIDPALGFMKMIVPAQTLKKVRDADKVLWALEFTIDTGFYEESMTNFYKKWIIAI